MRKTENKIRTNVYFFVKDTHDALSTKASKFAHSFGNYYNRHTNREIARHALNVVSLAAASTLIAFIGHKTGATDIVTNPFKEENPRMTPIARLDGVSPQTSTTTLVVEIDSTPTTTPIVIEIDSTASADRAEQTATVAIIDAKTKAPKNKPVQIVLDRSPNIPQPQTPVFQEPVRTPSSGNNPATVTTTIKAEPVTTTNQPATTIKATTTTTVTSTIAPTTAAPTTKAPATTVAPTTAAPTTAAPATTAAPTTTDAPPPTTESPILVIDL